MAGQTLPEQIERRFSALQSMRQPSEGIWRDCFDYLAPERAQGWFGNTDTAAGTSAAQRARLYDSTAIDAMEVLKSNIASWMTPENSRWFALDAGQDDEQSTRWMDGAAQFLWEHIHAGGFSAVSSELYSDLLPVGWFALYIDEGKDDHGREIGGFNFEAWPLNQCYVAASRSTGRVDTIYRCWSPTVEQVVNDYGIDAVSEETARKYRDGNMTDKVEVLWCIEPRQEGRSYANLAKNLRFRSCHMERNKKHILREGGYHEFPCAVPRWRLIPGTPYATGMGSVVLPDVKTLNDIKKLELMSLDVAVGGMWKAVDDGVLNPRSIKIGARKVIMMADINSMQPLETGANFNVAFTKCNELQQSIRRTLLADMLTPVGGPVRSATEIAQNINQIRQLMAPILGRLQTEFLQVLIERCFGIALRAGALQQALGPLPEQLQNSDYQVKYISPLARSQKMEEVNAIDMFASGLLAAMPAVGGTILDTLKLDEAMYEKALALGVPAKLLRGPDELLEKRQMDREAAQQAEQAQQQQAMQQMAGEAAIQNTVGA